FRCVVTLVNVIATRGRQLRRPRVGVAGNGLAAALVRGGLDDELSYYLLGLRALWIESLSFRRIVVCLRFFQAFPLRDAKTLWRLANQPNDLPSSRDDTGATTGGPSCGLRLGHVCGKGRSVDHFGLGDQVSLRLGLSLEALDRHGTKGHTCEH